MGLKRTKLLDVQSITGINTVGIFTVGVTDCTGPVGVASTTYLRGVMMHNAGGVGAGGSCNAAIYLYPKSAQGQEKAANTGIGDTNYRILRVNLNANETYYFEPNYPIVLVDRESIVVNVTKPDGNGSGIGSAVNFQILGDTDV